jgi:hypothetical protein
MAVHVEKIDDLREAIASHAAALAAGEIAAAEKFVLPQALGTHREAAAGIARLPRPITVETPALAKVGYQYVSKVKFINGDGDTMRRVLNRWRREPDGRWRIVSVEDTTGKRSPWSDIPDLAAATAQARGENGHA